MIIVCTSDLMGPETAEVDRETDVWFEKDLTIYGQYASMIYPKLHWKLVDEIIMPPSSPNKSPAD